MTTYKETPIKLSADFSTETLQARREWHDIFKMMKGKNLQPRILYPVAAAAAKLLQSCLTLCDPIDSSPPGSAVPMILKARTLEWVAISFSSA